MSRADERGSIIDSLMEIFESFRNFRTYTDQLFHARTLGKSIFDVLQYDSFAGSHNHFDVGSVAAIDDIFLCQQVSGGDHRCSQLMQGDGAVPELIAALQNQHHHVSATDAEALEVRGRHVRIAFHVGEGELTAFALVIGPEQSVLVGLFGSPGIYYVVAEVEILRYVYFQVLDEILL